VDWGLASGTPLSRARYALSWSWIGRRAGVLHSGALWRGRIDYVLFLESTSSS